MNVNIRLNRGAVEIHWKYRRWLALLSSFLQFLAHVPNVGLPCLPECLSSPLSHCKAIRLSHYHQSNRTDYGADCCISWSLFQTPHVRYLNLPDKLIAAPHAWIDGSLGLLFRLWRQWRNAKWARLLRDLPVHVPWIQRTRERTMRTDDIRILCCQNWELTYTIQQIGFHRRKVACFVVRPTHNVLWQIWP
jgi:hypothetical protein